MQQIIALSLLLMSFSIHAAVREITVTVDTGNDDIIAVSKCSEPAVETVMGAKYVFSQFVYTICKETKTYRAIKTTSDKFYHWGSETKAIAGTESYSYSIDTVPEGTDALVTNPFPLQGLDVKASCSQLRRATKKAVVAVSKTACVN